MDVTKTSTTQKKDRSDSGQQHAAAQLWFMYVLVSMLAGSGLMSTSKRSCTLLRVSLSSCTHTAHTTHSRLNHHVTHPDAWELRRRHPNNKPVPNHKHTQPLQQHSHTHHPPAC